MSIDEGQIAHADNKALRIATTPARRWEEKATGAALITDSRKAVLRDRNKKADLVVPPLELEEWST